MWTLDGGSVDGLRATGKTEAETKAETETDGRAKLANAIEKRPMQWKREQNHPAC